MFKTSMLMLVFVVASGCVSRPLPARPTVNELLQASIDDVATQCNVETIETVNFNDASEGQVIVDQDGNEIVGSDAPLVDPLDPATLGADAYFDGGIPLDLPKENEPIISEEFIETDIREVLTTIADDTGIDLVVDTQVAGVVNAQLDNLPLSRAIEKILVPLGYHYTQRDGQHYVGTPDPDSPLFPFIAERREYRPKHLDTSVLLDTIPGNMRQYAGAISGTNTILVEAPRRIADHIIDRFVAIDNPVPQVLLEAIICVVSPETNFQFGVDWDHAVELNGQNALNFGATGLALSAGFSPAGADAIFSDFASTSSFVRLLSQHGYLSIRATPRVMAQDNKQAEITISRESFFTVQPFGGNNNSDVSPFFFNQDIQTVESGISLVITPRIRDDIVTINIERAEVSEDVRNATSELDINRFPVINRRSVSTTVHVKDGRTVVIGGLVQRQTIDQVNRVPGLSKLPWLGYLFETTERQTLDTEVVIFISPKIVTP